MAPARGPNRFLDEIANQIIPQDFLPEDSRVLVGDEKKFVSWLGETYPEFAAEQAGRQAGREEGREEGFVEALSAATGIGGPAQSMQDVGWEGGFPGGGAGLADPVPTPVPPQFDPAAVPQVARPEPIPVGLAPPSDVITQPDLAITLPEPPLSDREGGFPGGGAGLLMPFSSRVMDRSREELLAITNAALARLPRERLEQLREWGKAIEGEPNFQGLPTTAENLIGHEVLEKMLLGDGIGFDDAHDQATRVFGSGVDRRGQEYGAIERSLKAILGEMPKESMWRAPSRIGRQPVPQVAQPEPIPGPMARRIEEGPQPVTLPGPEPTVPVPPPAPMGPLASPVPSALPRPQPTQVPDSVAVEAAVREQAEIARTFAERAQGLPAEGTPPSIRASQLPSNFEPGLSFGEAFRARGWRGAAEVLAESAGEALGEFISPIIPESAVEHLPGAVQFPAEVLRRVLSPAIITGGPVFAQGAPIVGTAGSGAALAAEAAVGVGAEAAALGAEQLGAPAWMQLGAGLGAGLGALGAIRAGQRFGPKVIDEAAFLAQGRRQAFARELPEGAAGLPDDELARAAGQLIEFVENFPLGAAARAQLQGDVDAVAQQILGNSGIRRIQVDMPASFELAQQAGVSSGGVLRINPVVQDIRQSVLHEAGHVLWMRATSAQQTWLREQVAKNFNILRDKSPGYARQFTEGEPEEAVAQLFARIHDLPGATRNDLLNFRPAGQSFDEVFPAVAHVAERPARVPQGILRSWEQIRRDGGFITQEDDLATIARVHGDQMVVIKDVNGGRSILPASQAARLLDDPMGSGFVREVFLSNLETPLGPAIPDSHTLGYLPQFQEAVERATGAVQPGAAAARDPLTVGPQAPRAAAALPEGAVVQPYKENPAAELRRLEGELDDIEAHIAVRQEESGTIVRPRWASNMTTDEIISVARQEGLSPFKPDWADSLDSDVIREARQGVYRTTTPSIPDLRKQRKALNEYVVELRRRVSEEAVVPQAQRGAVVQPEAAVGLPGPEDVAGPPGRDAARAALETEVAAGAPASRQLALRPAASAADVTESAAAREAIETSAVVERSAALDSGKMPPRRTGGTESPGSPPPPRDPARTLANILEDAPPHERIERTARRRLSASTRITSLELENWVREGEQIARQGKVNLGRITPDEGDALFRVLHGEAPLEGLDARFHPLIEHTRRLRDIEQADMLAFLKEAGDADIAFLAYDLRTMADRMMAIPEYFPRLWKKPGDAVIRARGARGRFGATPSAARGRVDATYSELREAGFEPRSWNPLVMMALRRLEGVNYRTQIMVANGLRRAGKMLPVGEAPEGWRVPKGVGRVFESRPVPRLEGLTREQGQAVREWGEAVMRGQDPGPFPGEVMTTPQLAVPNEIADTLERMFAKPFQAFLPVGRHEIDLARVMDLISNNLKRILFVGSSFQHFDMATRMLMGNRFWRRNVYRLGHGGAVRAPGLVANMLDVTFRPGARRALRQQFLSTERIVPEAANSPTWRMLVDEGLNIEGDTQLIAREAMQFMRVVEEQMAGRVVGRALAMFKQMRDYWESGLFEGMYRLGMKDSIENFAAVNVLRQHPDWTARQVAAEIAEIVNTQYSALDLWQQVVFRNPNVQRMAQWGVLSTNESDALIRQAINMIPGLSGRNKRIWADWYVGMFVGIAAIANVINFMATGKALPPASYVPVKVDDPYGPFKVGYANSFLSPQIPFIKGRGGEPIYLDMVGQMDTVLRWLVDPVQALANRLNVLPRAVMNQAEGETFFGEKLDTPAKRAVQAAADTITPMFGEQALQIVRGQVRALEEVIPGGETRLGPAGLGFQGFLGLNVRAETTGNILEREARTFTNGERGLEDMRYVESIRFRRQLSEEVKAEFDLRTREQAERGSKFAGYRMRLDDLSGEQIIREASLLRDLFTGRWGDTPASAYWEWRDAYQTVQTEVRRSKRDARREFEIVDRDDPVSVDPLDQALDEYFTIAERAADAAGNFHLDKWVKLLEEAQTGWTEAQREYVEEYRSLREHAPGVSGLLELARPDATGYRAKITASILNRFWRDHREEWEAMLAEVARTPAPVVPVGTPRPAYLDTREESLRLFREQQQRQQQPAGVR